MILVAAFVGALLFLMFDSSVRVWNHSSRWTPVDAEIYHAPPDHDWN